MKKLLISILLITIIFISSPNLVRAEELHLTMDQVVTKFNELFKDMADDAEIEEVLTAKVEDNKLAIMSEDEKVMEFTIAGDVISDTFTIDDMENEDAVWEAFGNIFIKYIIYTNLIDSVAYLHNYTERDVRTFVNINDENAETTMAEDGYELKVEMEGEKQAKMTFQIDINKFNLKLDYLNLPAPTLKLTNATVNSVDISINGEVEDGKMIEIYRSTDNKNFELVISASYNKDVEVTITDDELEPDTAYYYKAVLAKSKNFSDVVTIKTLAEEPEFYEAVEESKKEEASKPAIPADADKPTDNKQTGGFSIFSFSLLIPTSFLGLRLLNKKKLMSKI